MIKLKLLRYFKVVVECGSISAAAKVLFIAQPPLSKALQQLEQQWHVQLFKRSSKGMVPTEAGRYLYQKACYLLHEAALLEESMLAYGQGQQGVVRMGSVAMGLPYLTAMIKMIHQKQPGVSFSLQQGDTASLEELLHSQRIDIALVHLPLSTITKEAAITPLKRSTFKALCHVDSPLANHPQLTLADLAKQPLALMRRKMGFGVYDNVLNSFAKAKLSPAIFGDANDVPMLLHLVKQQLAIALLPVLDGEDYGHEIVALPVPELELVADELALIYLTPQTSLALRQIIEQITASASLAQAH